MAPAPSADCTADVVVMGGGPGGSTTATMLARQGWQVLLLDREHFPRDHIGESLLPASIPVLAELGVLPAVQEAGFLPKWGATMVWGCGKVTRLSMSSLPTVERWGCVTRPTALRGPPERVSS